MPLVRIENYPKQIVLQDKPAIIQHNNASALQNPNPDMAAWRLKLADKLAVAFVRAELHNITDLKEVHVVFGGQQVRQDDNTMLILVEGLFANIDRNKPALKRLALMLGHEALANLPKCWPRWEVKVLANSLNPDIYTRTVYNERGEIKGS